MSAFDDDFAVSAAPEQMAQFADADAFVYTTPGGTATTLSAIAGELSAEEMRARVREDGAAREIERQIKIDLPRTAAIAAAAGGSSGYIAGPVKSATIAYGGRTWSVREIVAQTAAFTTVLAVEVGALDRSRTGYRR